MQDNERADYIWMDGEFVEWDNAKVHVKTHALHYGSGVFEGIRGYFFDDNVHIFRLDSHLDRMYYSARIYRMEIPYTKEELTEAIKELIRINKIKEVCYIRPIAYRGYGPLGLNPLNKPVNVAIYAIPFGEYLGQGALEKGVTCMISSWERISPRALPPEAKACGQYLNSILARLEAVENGYTEAIMLDHRGFIGEGTGENIFMIKDGGVYTTPLHASNLRGITRDTVITLFKEEMGIEVKVEEKTRGELYGMDEVFICGTAGEITPVVKIDGLVYGDGKPGKITRKMQKIYSDVVNGRYEKYRHWLTPVY
ncbi:MAG: branched-chain amino acid transaminase [Candidatus Odinarchaeia archaeon]